MEVMNKEHVNMLNNKSHIINLIDAKKTFDKIQNGNSWDFPGGAVLKSSPANAGNTGSSPGPGRSHMLRSN